MMPDTYRCGFCGQRVPVESDAGHVDGECVPSTVAENQAEALEVERHQERKHGDPED
jgi:hypothetical protein